MSSESTGAAIAEAPQDGSALGGRPFADPLALGLTSFGLCVLLLSATTVGLIDPAALPVAVFPVALTAGAIGHIAAGLMHFRRGEGFPGTVLLTYSTFWISYVLIGQVYVPGVVAKGGDPVPAIGWFILIYALITTYFTITAFATTKTLSLLFAALLVGLYLTAAATFAGSAGLSKIAGWILIFDALLALYVAASLMVNEAWGRTVLPAP